MEYVAHHGRETAYRYEGEGDPPVLLIHGSGGSSALWNRQFRLAEERARSVAALDLSGHGESDDVDAAPGYETLSAHAADAVAVARATGADVLVGHSLGGAAALTVALDRTLPLRGLVLAGTGSRPAVLEDLRTWLAADFERAIEFLHRPDVLLHDPDDDLRAMSAATMRGTGQRVTRRDFLTVHEFDVRDRLEGIDAPALAVVGEYDRLTPRRYHQSLADRMPDCDLRTIEDAAHLTMLERPDAFDAVVDEFLDRLDG